MKRFLISVAALLAACTPYSETIGGAAPTGTIWALQSINDTPFTASATMEFASGGSVTGNAPCNTYSARQTAPLPWFEVANIAVTKRACPDLAQETLFLETLARMDFSEIGAEKLLLSNSDNEVMLFINQASLPQS